jgi:hypothetical protein
MAKTAKLKSVVYSVNIDFLSKKSLSESGRCRIMGIITELVEKNKDLFGEDLRIYGYGVDNGHAATGAWERMDRNRVAMETEQAEEYYGRQMELMNRDYFKKTLPEEAKMYAKEKAKYVSFDCEITEGTLEELVDVLPNVLQNDDLLFWWDPDSREIEVVTRDEGYRVVGTIGFGS